MLKMPQRYTIAIVHSDGDNPCCLCSTSFVLPHYLPVTGISIINVLKSSNMEGSQQTIKATDLSKRNDFFQNQSETTTIREAKPHLLRKQNIKCHVFFLLIWVFFNLFSFKMNCFFVDIHNFCLFFSPMIQFWSQSLLSRLLD